MPLSDEQYLAKYGYTREEGKERKKANQKKAMKEYWKRKKEGKAGKKRGRKKGTSVVIHRRSSKVISTNGQLITGLSQIRITTADLIILEQMQSDARELVRSTFEKHLNSKEQGHG